MEYSIILLMKNYLISEKYDCFFFRIKKKTEFFKALMKSEVV